MPVRKLTLKNDRVRVVTWIRSGAPLREGVSLYASLFPDPDFLYQLKKNPELNREKLYLSFCEMMDISYEKFQRIVNENYGNRSKETGTGSVGQEKNEKSRPPRNNSRSFRNEWPFLSRSDCPTQLKALASDKISCWERYTEAHKKLFDCATLEECYQVAHTLIENFKENRQIFDELEYYKQNGSVLGMHPVFNQFKRFDDLKGKNIIELVRLYETTLPHRIWRIESEIKKGDKPHLNGEREKRLQEVQAELAEVKRLLNL